MSDKPATLVINRARKYEAPFYVTEKAVVAEHDAVCEWYEAELARLTAIIDGNGRAIVEKDTMLAEFRASVKYHCTRVDARDAELQGLHKRYDIQAAEAKDWEAKACALAAELAAVKGARVVPATVTYERWLYRYNNGRFEHRSIDADEVQMWQEATFLPITHLTEILAPRDAKPRFVHEEVFAYLCRINEGDTPWKWTPGDVIDALRKEFPALFASEAS